MTDYGKGTAKAMGSRNVTHVLQLLLTFFFPTVSMSKMTSYIRIESVLLVNVPRNINQVDIYLAPSIGYIPAQFIADYNTIKSVSFVLSRYVFD